MAEQRLDSAVAYSALVRYDAYGEMSGRQSTSIALLDAHRSGLVLSSIHHRDQARLYAKQVREGQPELELSPEESEAIRLALEGGSASRAASVALSISTAMRVGYFGPEGTFTQEALIEALSGGSDRRLADGARAGSAPDDLRHGDGGPHRSRASGRWSRSRTRSRARSTRRSTRSRWRPTTSRSSARSCIRSGTA